MKPHFSAALLAVSAVLAAPMRAAEEAPKVPLPATNPLITAPAPAVAEPKPAELPKAPPPVLPKGEPEAAQAWDYRSLADWRRILAPEPLMNVAFLPGGKTIAAGGDGKVFFWNLLGELQSTLITETAPPTPPKVVDPKEDLLGVKPAAPAAPKHIVRLMAFSPDGKLLATSSDSTVKLWKVEGGALIKTLAGHQADVTCIAFTSDGRALATGSLDKSIRLWNSENGLLLGALTQHVYPVRAVAFTADVKTLLSVGAQGKGRKNAELKIWNVAGKGEQVLEETLDNVAIGATQIVADGRVLASGSDGVYPWVRLWEAQTGKFVRSTIPGFATGVPVTTLAFTPDFRLVAGGGAITRRGSNVWLWDVRTGKMIKEIKTSPQNGIAFSPDGRMLAVAGQDQSVQLWRVP